MLLDRINVCAERLMTQPRAAELLGGPNKQSVRFAAGGLYNVVIAWFNGGLKESPEDIAASLCIRPDAT
jgi:hypothetical protein